MVQHTIKYGYIVLTPALRSSSIHFLLYSFNVPDFETDRTFAHMYITLYIINCRIKYQFFFHSSLDINLLSCSLINNFDFMH